LEIKLVCFFSDFMYNDIKGRRNEIKPFVLDIRLTSNENSANGAKA